MIETRRTGDIFDCGAQAITNTVNCVGVMGKGIALEFKKRYPEMFSEYAKLCRRNYIQTGKVWVWHEVPNCTCGCYFDDHGMYSQDSDPAIITQPCGSDSCGCRDYTSSHINEYIINFPTKEDWRNPSQLEWISAGLDDLRTYVTMDLPIRSLAMPALGCSNGGLRFEDVQALVYEKLEGLDADIILFEPR